MEINDLEFYLVEIECSEPEQPVRSVLVRLMSESGLEGWGESALRWEASELPGRRDTLLPVLAGRSVFDIEELLALPALSQPPLRAALEMACWDLVGRVTGQPLCHLFGGGYRTRIPLAVRLPTGSTDHAVGIARELAEQGFHSQIVPASGRVEEDVRRLAAIRESIGDRAELRFDGAGAFESEAARDLCAELEEGGLQFLLDPLKTAELQAVASLARQTNVPMAVSRPIHGPRDVLAAVRSSAALFVVVELGRVGGIVSARNSAAVAEAGGIAALLSTGPSLGIATAAMLQLAAATPAFSGCNECAYPQLLDDVLAEPFEIIDGRMTVPQGPGLGIEIDRAKAERYQVT